MYRGENFVRSFSQVNTLKLKINRLLSTHFSDKKAPILGAF